MFKDLIGEGLLGGAIALIACMVFFTWLNSPQKRDQEPVLSNDTSGNHSSKFRSPPWYKEDVELHEKSRARYNAER
jgi:hypothetical protein